MRLIKGGLDYTCRMGATALGIVPLEAPAPVVDAVVVEQDTHGLLAVETQLVETSPCHTSPASLVSLCPTTGEWWW